MIPVSSRTAKENFYPTPTTLAMKMLSGVDWTLIETVLEPSAGKGDLVHAIRRQNLNRWSHQPEIDCIEIDDYLRQALSYDVREDKQVRIVHDDFFTYRAYKHYDLIVMNPPFDTGDAHLLRALEIQKRGGAIICLLNAETLRNPYTHTRRELAAQLERHSAEIEYVKGAFTHAERPSDVEIAVVRVSIPTAKDESDIYTNMQKAEEQGEQLAQRPGEMVFFDFIQQIVQRYNVEVRASLELIRQYEAMVPHILSDLREGSYPHPLLTLVTGSSGHNYREASVNGCLQQIREKYWSALLCDKRFTGRLTSNLQEKYRERTDKLRDYEFSEFNIRQIMVELNAEMITGVQETIITLFDKLTAEHSWYPECANNRHYYTGWATNRAHKIGKKSIIPCYTSADSWSKQAFDVNRANNTLGDIEKTLNYLAGERSGNDIDLCATLTEAARGGQNRKIRCKYFLVDIFKKGTIHITYSDPELIERFNIYAGKTKNWLPPSYGKAQYKDMAEDERAVVDTFQGEEEYAKVMSQPDLYLIEAPGLLMLGADIKA